MVDYSLINRPIAACLTVFGMSVIAVLVAENFVFVAAKKIVINNSDIAAFVGKAATVERLAVAVVAADTLALFAENIQQLDATLYLRHSLQFGNRYPLRYARLNRSFPLLLTLRFSDLVPSMYRLRPLQAATNYSSLYMTLAHQLTPHFYKPDLDQCPC